LRLLKFEDLLRNEGNDKSLESLHHLTNEIEKQVTELKESDFEHKLKTSINNYEKTIHNLTESNNDLNIRYNDQINKCKNLQKRIETIMHENKELKEEINEIEPVLDKISGYNEQLTQGEKDSVISKMSKKLSTLRENKEQLSQTVAKLEKQI